MLWNRWITFIEAVRDIGNQQTEKPVSIADMKQSLCNVHNGQQGRQLYEKGKMNTDSRQQFVRTISLKWIIFRLALQKYEVDFTNIQLMFVHIYFSSLSSSSVSFVAIYDIQYILYPKTYICMMLFLRLHVYKNLFFTNFYIWANLAHTCCVIEGILEPTILLLASSTLVQKAIIFNTITLPQHL